MNLISRVAARYKKKHQIETSDGDTRTVYEYSDRQVALRNRAKANRVEQLSKKIPKLRKQLFKDLDSKDSKLSEIALVVGLIDETYERVGNPQSAEDGHYGVTGWKKKHVTFGKDTATLKYIGKSGVKQTKVVKDPALRKALKRIYDSAEGDDLFQVKSSDVNDYLKSFDITAKDLRGFHANDVMRFFLKESRSGSLPKDKKERAALLKKEFLSALDAAASAIGHEASTLRTQYLTPSFEETYLKDGTILDKLDT